MGFQVISKKLIQQVQVISKKLIKPSIPTPSHLQNMSMSFVDQVTAVRTVPIILYYSSNIGNHHANSIRHAAQRQKLLEKSLSEILTLYYPIAGRYVKEKNSINCNDEGVEYAEAVVDGQLSEILQGKIEPKELNRYVPDEVEESAISPFLSIQINIFNCGGLAIGVRLSHRIIDGFTIFMILNGWAKACKVGNVNDCIVPNFESGILFPPRDLSKYQLPSLSKSKSGQVITKRFVFDSKKISNLKANQAAMRLNYKPSTNVVLIALMWMAQINAARARYGLKSSQLLVLMNLRGDKKLKKIPDNCCGNLITFIITRFDQAKESKIWGLNDFVDQVSDAVRNTKMEYEKVIEGPVDNEDEFFSKVIMKPLIDLSEGIRKGDGDVHIFSSVRNFPVYEVDFGWGKPTWVSFAQRPYKGVLLIEGRNGDGVEAWVTMDEEEMAYFQNDPNVVSLEH